MHHIHHIVPQVIFEEINARIRDPKKPVTGGHMLGGSLNAVMVRAGGLILASSDAIGRAQWCSMMEGCGSNKFCHMCDVSRADIAYYHDFLQEPGTGSLYASQAHLHNVLMC